MPDTHIDEVTGDIQEKGSVVALKRAIVPPGTKTIQDGLAKRINLLFNEVLTMRHPPLAAHPNIVQLLGIGFESEGPDSDRNVMPTLVPECAELGNLAEVLETAKREDRPLSFDQKLAFCVDVAHGLEALHACDIIHGDVKCENVLVFENTPSDEGLSDSQERHLVCKLTDFGYSHLDASSNGFPLGGSPPWNAPECFSGTYFKIETAKRTDIYSFGLLVWRLMLDGDPFASMKFEGDTEKEQRARRNEFVTTLKNNDKLAEHVCQSLEMSVSLTEQQLSILRRVIRCTLTKDPSQRELDMARLIRLLSPDFWYHSRQIVSPKRISFDTDIKLLDIEKHFHELRKSDGVVKEHIAKSFQNYAKGLAGDKVQKPGAAYQLAVCYALGFGVAFQPDECLKWLNIASMGGFGPAQVALPRFAHVFHDELRDYVIPTAADAMEDLSLDSARNPSHEVPNIVGASPSEHVEYRGGKFHHNGKVIEGTALLLKAAERGQYEIMEMTLSNGISGASGTEEGVTALHFLSFWDVEKAKYWGQKLIAAGGNINAIARRGTSVGGSPLMWAVSEDRKQHSQIIIELGGKPTASDILGNSALSFSAKLHLSDHMRLLLKSVRPAEIDGWLHCLLVSALSGESRFARIIRHGIEWKTVPQKINVLLQAWNLVVGETEDWHHVLLSAITESLDTTFGPSNTDIQLLFLDNSTVKPIECSRLLGASIIRDNKDLFDGLLQREVPITSRYENEKTLLHLCAQNPNSTTTHVYYAKKVLELPGVEINARDSTGRTPFMDALLARKWDLAGFLLSRGADPLITTNAGYNVLGLIIQTLNLGAAKWAFKYSGAGDLFRESAFIVHPEKNISAIQEAAKLKLPRAHGMKTEVSGLFLFILANFMDRGKIDFRSDGILPNASALDIAAVNGNIHAVKALCKKDAHVASGQSALGLARKALENVEEGDFLAKKNLERCVYVIENWGKDAKGTEKVADGWTKLRTIDESHVRSSWEVIAWEWKVPNKPASGGERKELYVVS
ncbi:hypothetical protein G7Y79_00013g033850 [Physcia stellaris]|nr:hypothetical protein G7Y79_00013g033850 [Physcia stellaris]